MNILSWNVLLMDYEKKYNPNSIRLKKWKNEDDRVDIIINILSKNSDINSIICLQEVSILLFSKIKEIFSDRLVFHKKVTDIECIVTITPKEYIEENINKNSATREILSVYNSKTGYRIINTHLKPQRYCNLNIMRYINSLSNNTIVVGDFNENYKIVKKLLNNFIVEYFGNTYKKKQIDHIVYDKKLYKKNISKTKIVVDDISDHNLIILVYSSSDEEL